MSPTHFSQPEQQTLSRRNVDKYLSEERKNPKLAKSIGKTAARAGSAILPPTFMREINASKQAQQSASIRSPATSPSASSSHSTQRRSSPLQLRPSSSDQRARESYFDPPPVYDPILSINPSSGSAPSSNAAPSPVSNTSPARDLARAPSSSGSTVDVDPIDAAAGSPAAPTGPHPHSIHAAGPGQRSILHANGRQNGVRTRESPQASPATVRFDPEAVNNAIQRSATADFGERGTSDLASSSLPASTRSPSSEPSSARTSFEGSRTAFTTQNTVQGKGKGRMQIPSQGSSMPKRGIKSILGTLLKEDDERHRNEARLAMVEDEEGHLDWREFKKGTYTYPFSIPLPSNLPPTLHADFGSNAYVMRAHVHRAGPLTSNLSAEKEVTLVHAPDEEGSDEVESIVVERNWEDALRYIVVVMGKSFPVGGRIPIWAKFVPTEKVRIHRILASLEERTAYYAKGRRVVRHEVPRRWTLLKVLPNSQEDGILPIMSTAQDALKASHVTQYARAAQQLYSDASDFAATDAVASLMDPTGPWELALDLEVPKCASTRINISSNHNKSNIAVHHLVKIAIRVERIDASSDSSKRSSATGKAPDSKRKLFDIIIDAPISINHSHTANIWLSLPDYWSVPPSSDNEDSADVAARNGPSPGTQGLASMATLSGALQAPGEDAKGKARSGGQGALPGWPDSPSTPARPSAPSGSSSSGALMSTATSSPPSTQLTSSAGSSAAGAAATRNAQLVQLSRTWLSLTGAASESGGAGGSSIPPPFAPSSNATVTYSESFVNGGAGSVADDPGLPTYDMIDRERGSVDPPPSRRAHSIK